MQALPQVTPVNMNGNPATLILLTRPLAQSLAYRDVLMRDMAAGAAIIVSPLFKIEPVDGVLDLRGATALIFTSVNGVGAFCQRSERRDFICYCVGDRTAERAAEMGFDPVSADGATDDLLRLLRENPPTGKIIHIHGAHVAADLLAPLAREGVNISETVLYRQAETPLTAKALDGIAKADHVIVPLFSPRTARLFLGQTDAGSRRKISLACISKAVADQVSGHGFRAVTIATRPTADSVTREIAALR